MPKHTDLAMEARELWQESAKKEEQLPGVKTGRWTLGGVTADQVQITDKQAEQALGKPCGTYVTLQWQKNLLRDPDGFSKVARLLGNQLRQMLPRTGSVLVVGLGNSVVTPDALGPKTLEHLVVTRHLGQEFPKLRCVSAMAPGVLGTTGLESLEVVRGVVERSKPCTVVVVDALASRNLNRVCTTVQLADTGITPGSGVGNRRMAFNRQTLGVPVIAVGVPTVVQAQTLLWDVLEKNGVKDGKIEEKCDNSMIVTPQDIDAGVDRLARLLGCGISLGLHRKLTVSDVSCFVG